MKTAQRAGGSITNYVRAACRRLYYELRTAQRAMKTAQRAGGSITNYELFNAMSI